MVDLGEVFQLPVPHDRGGAASHVCVKLARIHSLSCKLRQQVPSIDEQHLAE